MSCQTDAWTFRWQLEQWRDGGSFGALCCGMFGILAYLSAALFSPWLAPNDPLAIDLSLRLQSSSVQFPLGTDPLGRCVLSRLLFGARTTLASAALILGATLAVGSTIGLAAGFLGGKLDYMAQRLLDGLMAFPGLILAIALAGLLGPGIENAVLALMLVHWAGYARIVRNMTLTLRERNYITAARIAGAGPISILRRHILPAIAPSLGVIATFDFGRIILSVAGLSFLGLGVQPPAPEWGAMISEGKSYLQAAPSLMLWPGLAIMGSVISLQLLGVGLDSERRE